MNRSIKIFPDVDPLHRPDKVYLYILSRVSLLHDIARRHFLSRNLYKWKKMYDLRQKTRLANVHFK